MIETPTKQGYVTPISGYKQRISKSVSLQSGLAQAAAQAQQAHAREKARASGAVTSGSSSSTSLANAPQSAPSAHVDQVHKSHSDEEILGLKINVSDADVKDPTQQNFQVTITQEKTDADGSRKSDAENKMAAAASDRVKRPRTLPLGSCEEAPPGGCGSLPVDEEERGVASGASSPKVMEEISETISKIQQLGKPAAAESGSDIYRDAASLGEWYGGESAAERSADTQSKPTTSVSQESIEA